MKSILLFFLILLTVFQIQAQDFGDIGRALQHKQQKYDRVKRLIAEANFDIKCLAIDRTRASEITDEFNLSRSKLYNSLEQTKNYTAAESILNELSQLFKSDFEIVFIRNNYADFMNENNFRKELVANGKMKFDTYADWKMSVLNAYRIMGGANCNRYLSKCNSMSDILLEY